MTILIAKCDEGGNHGASFTDDPESRRQMMIDHDECVGVEAPDDTTVAAGPCSHFPNQSPESAAASSINRSQHEGIRQAAGYKV